MYSQPLFASPRPHPPLPRQGLASSATSEEDEKEGSRPASEGAHSRASHEPAAIDSRVDREFTAIAVADPLTPVPGKLEPPAPRFGHSGGNAYRVHPSGGAEEGNEEGEGDPGTRSPLSSMSPKTNVSHYPARSSGSFVDKAAAMLPRITSVPGETNHRLSGDSVGLQANSLLRSTSERPVTRVSQKPRQNRLSLLRCHAFGSSFPRLLATATTISLDHSLGCLLQDGS